MFPNVIHHYQVFGEKESKVIYLYLDPTLFPSYYKELQIYSPKNPVVKKEQVHPDVVNAIKYLVEITEGNPNADTGICTDDPCTCFRRQCQ